MKTINELTLFKIKKISRLRTYKLEKEILCPAVEEIASKLLKIEMQRNKGKISTQDHKYRKIALGIMYDLGMWPIPPWAPAHLRISFRLANPELDLYSVAYSLRE